MVAPGDAVAVNQPVCEIETAKSLVELPSPWDGTVLELLVAEGANGAVGEPILAVEVAGAEPEATKPQATQTPAPGGEAGSGATLVGYGNRPAEGARRLWAGLAAMWVAWRTRNVLATIGAGMAALYLLKLLFPT